MLVTRFGDRTAINSFERDEGSTRREKQRLVKVSQLFLSETVSGRNLKACRQIRRLIGRSVTSDGLLVFDTGAMLHQLSYEATDVGSRSVVGSYVPVKEMSVNDIRNKSYMNCGNEMNM